MKNYLTLQTEIEFLRMVKNLCLAYEEISVMKMQKIRESVIQNRSFYEKISEVYYEVKGSYKNKVLSIMKKKHITDPKKLMLFAKNGKTVTVLISANTKLYGTITEKIFRLFREAVTRQTTDIMIVGRLGKKAFDNLKLDKKYLFFEIPDTEITLETIKPILFHLVQYETVNVFYGRFENLMYQNAQLSNVTGDIPFKPSEETKEIERFLFEPTLEKILQFFEEHMFSSLLRQTMFESQLARFASRIQAMEQALSPVQTEQNKRRFEKNLYLKRLSDKKQQERLAGMSLWVKY